MNKEPHTINSQATPELFTSLKICVLIATYNNAGTLKEVITEVLLYTRNVVVVNDGSTDGTEAILALFPQITIVSYMPNKGKGFALRTGIKKAYELGYEYALSIDSDGQHYPSDLPLFAEKIRTVPGALIIGARNMTVDNVPQKSNFGNQFSNFWFWVETGVRMPDTQSGYRLYPLTKLGRKTFFTRKYEFEIEVIVRASWVGIPVISIPVSVYYPPADERVSHFRPFKDFSRISVLNTVLTLIALLYIKPRDLVRSVLKKGGFQNLLKTIFIHPEESNLRKAASIGFGVFMGIVPVWGFQLLIGIPLAILLRLNKALFLIAANISIFPITPFWFMLSLVTGKWLMGYNAWVFDWHQLTLEYVKKEGAAFFLGGAVLAISLGAFSFFISFLLLSISRRQQKP